MALISRSNNTADEKEPNQIEKQKQRVIEAILLFFVYCGAVFDIKVSGYICTFGNDKADEESYDSSSAFIIAIFIYSLYKSIRGRCAR